MGNLYSDDKQDAELFAPFRALRRHDLKTLRLVSDHQGKTVSTVGGMILFGHHRERHFPDAWIQAAGPDPAGHWFRQDDRRHHGDLPLDQVLRRPPGALPGGPQQPRQAGLNGVPGVLSANHPRFKVPGPGAGAQQHRAHPAGEGKPRHALRFLPRHLGRLLPPPGSRAPASHHRGLGPLRRTVRIRRD